jgi:hypothetical protein
MRYSFRIEGDAGYRYRTNAEPADAGTRLVVTIHARPLRACASAFDTEAGSIVITLICFSRILDVVADIDVVGLLPNVTMPTLVLHCRGDAQHEPNQDLARIVVIGTFALIKPSLLESFDSGRRDSLPAPSRERRVPAKAIANWRQHA